MFDQVLNAPLISSTPPNYFCLRIIKTFRFSSTAKLSSIFGTTYKIKSTYILLPFSIISISFATAFHALITTFFSPNYLSCLSNNAGYCFTFSQNIPFILQSQCCHPVSICSFISFSFVKMLLQVTHTFNYSSVFSEVFLYHEYQNVLIFSSHYFMK